MNNREKKRYIELWQEAFGDPAWLIEIIFSADTKSYGLFRDGELISAFHLVPKTLIVKEKKYNIFLLAGAATKKELRGQGIFKDLFINTVNKLMQNTKGPDGADAIVLYPDIKGYYEKLGFGKLNCKTLQTGGGYDSYIAHNEDDLSRIKMILKNDPGLADDFNKNVANEILWLPLSERAKKLKNFGTLLFTCKYI